MIKVASYCRVSTDSEDQANSFESQQQYFREYINRHPDWELYEVYADEGTTGTSTKKRTQFNRMISDAYKGKFKLIVTKEVSRFSRNLLDTIAYTRELKSLGIGVIFMTDGFSTLDADAELRLSIMGSLAQEESRKTSARVKWGQTRQMEKGVVFGTSLLGYDVKDGKLTINPEGAEIVKRIFHMYGIEKKGTTVIAHELRESGIRTYTNNPLWSGSHIVKILKNEKYVGDLIQKKTITPDFLTHSKKRNKGEEEMVVIKNHHEGIISRELWDIVQEELKNRNRNTSASTGHSNRYVFSGKMICAECGARFISRRKTRKDGSSYMRWGCFNAANYGTKKVDSQGNTMGCDIGKQIRDDLAIETLTKVIKSIPVDYTWIIKNLTSIIATVICNGESSPESSIKIERQISQLLKKKADVIDAYISDIITKEEMKQMNAHYDAKIVPLQQKLAECQKSKAQGPDKLQTDIQKQINAIVTCKSFTEPYFKALLEKMVVHKDGQLDITINHLPQIWKYLIEYHKTNPNIEF